MLEENKRAIVWTIAGSDCSGGAGIQADLKTMHNLDCEVCTVITANTAQNSLGVDEINAVNEDVLWSQLKALHQDKPAKVIKIGLLANKRQVDLIADWIMRCQRDWPQPPIVVYDPVAIASAGGDLVEEDILPIIKQKLFPLVDVLTPNADEAQRLSGVYIINWQSMLDVSASLQQMGIGAVVVKGGHIDIDGRYCVDLADNGVNQYWLASDKIETEHSHGSGCTFASAVAACLAQGYLLRDAVTVAKAYINQGLTRSAEFDGIYGPIWQGPWPLKLQQYPKIIQPNSPLANELDWQIDGFEQTSWADDFASCDTQHLGLYPVVGSVEWIEFLLKQGIKTLQLRIKNKSCDEVEADIVSAIELGKQYQARLFINDYWQLAVKHGAYGVHLGQEDVQSADLNLIKQAGLRLGISTHGEYEFLAAMQLKPSYIAVGAIYPTKTKDMSGQIQGIKRLNHYLRLNAQNTQPFPMVAIGGINLERAEKVWQTGVGSVAVVTAITEADEPEKAIAQLSRNFAM
ncbi:thiamine phosphate synthase [Catenovulum sp. 2E275]|uniref:thiamine phosphate synthase n=1 Tax=Catenovulum sp. 2E275 TaxID=2980497 RepID=UPI0021CEFE21|nr:thiamine phosphate synthase [Catenovulum sp. 2E275]MCU4674997.1 thiamine phosphate synthase [Catenovulum sp. 2E275]